METEHMAATSAVRRPAKVLVADYISSQIQMSDKSQVQIAAEIGYDKPNVLTMIKQGKTKLPINKVGPLAKSLGIDPSHLLRMVMSEYMPDSWAAIEDLIGQSLVSDHEMHILRTLREFTGERDPEMTNDDQRKALFAFAKTLLGK